VLRHADNLTPAHTAKTRNGAPTFTEEAKGKLQACPAALHSQQKRWQRRLQAFCPATGKESAVRPAGSAIDE
jgi:hypothetical protein